MRAGEIDAVVELTAVLLVLVLHFLILLGQPHRNLLSIHLLDVLPGVNLRKGLLQGGLHLGRRGGGLERRRCKELWWRQLNATAAIATALQHLGPQLVGVSLLLFLCNLSV